MIFLAIAAAACAPTARLVLAADLPPGAEPLALRSLSDVLSRTERVAAFRFEKPCFDCRVADLTVRDIRERINPKPLDAQQASDFKKLLSEGMGTRLSPPKDCKSIWAEEGFVLYQPDSIAIFLIYPYCMTARLILERDSPPDLFNVNDLYCPLCGLAGAHWDGCGPRFRPGISTLPSRDVCKEGIAK